MKILYLLTLVFASITCASAQQLRTNDAAAFERYLSNTFAEYYPLSLLQRVYKYMDSYANCSVGNIRYVRSLYRESSGGNFQSADHAENTLGIFLPGDYTPTVMVGKEQGFSQSHRHYDDRAFPDTLRIVFKQCFKDFRHEFPKKRNAMRRTIEQLEAFSKAAEHKPKFFVNIDQQYGGDISAYVKDMYDQSCLLNGKQFQRFLRKPSAIRLQNDMGVQFVIGIAIYRLWLKEQMDK